MIKPNLTDLADWALGEASVAHWDDDLRNSFVEELMHLAAELAEVFEAWRVYKDYDIHWEPNDTGTIVPQGVPIELADVILGVFYNVGVHNIDIVEALSVKHNFNLSRDYRLEGRQLHP